MQKTSLENIYNYLHCKNFLSSTDKIMKNALVIVFQSWIYTVEKRFFEELKQRLFTQKVQSPTLLITIFSYFSTSPKQVERKQLYYIITLLSLHSKLPAVQWPKKIPEYDPVFYRIGTYFFHIYAYQDHIQKNTGSYSGVFRVVSCK